MPGSELKHDWLKNFTGGYKRLLRSYDFIDLRSVR